MSKWNGKLTVANFDAQDWRTATLETIVRCESDRATIDSADVVVVGADYTTRGCRTLKNRLGALALIEDKSPGEVFVMMCDGLMGGLRNEEAA